MSSIRFVMLSLGFAAIASPLSAQAGAATGLCGDGTTTSAKTKSGACSNHGGVKTWYADAPAAPAPKAAPAAKTAAPTAAPSKPAPAPAPKMDAPKTTAKIPAGMTGKCGDGTFTAAKSKSGACSNHGGVAEWYGAAPSAAAAPAAPPPPAPKAAPMAAPKAAPSAPAPKSSASPMVKPIAGAPAAATALCNDGTYSESQHRSGSCSSHGGVKQWLKEIPPQE